jgi:hypothetical protein
MYLSIYLYHFVSHALEFSTHWGNMHGLLGHSRVTLHTVIRIRALWHNYVRSLLPTLLQGDITDENFVQSVVQNVAAFHVTSLQLACVILFEGSP